MTSHQCDEKPHSDIASFTLPLFLKIRYLELPTHVLEPTPITSIQSPELALSILLLHSNS